MQPTLFSNNKLWFEYKNYRQSHRFLNLLENEKKIVEQFNKEGYYLFKNAISEETISHVNNALDEWIAENKAALDANKRPDTTYPRLIGLHEKVPALHELFKQESTLNIQDLLFGCKTSPYITTITFLQGSQQELHRDIPVFNIAPGTLYFRIWFALEDVNSENGPLTGVPDAHKIADEPYKVKQKFYKSFEEIPEQDPLVWYRYQEKLNSAYKQAGLAEEKFELSKGDFLIWHPLFPHGGSEIINKDASRRSVVLHFTLPTYF